MFLTPMAMYFIGLLINEESIEQLNGNVRSITEITTDLSYNGKQTKKTYSYNENGLLVHKVDSSPFIRHYEYSYTGNLLTHYKQTSLIAFESDDIQLKEFKYDDKKRLIFQKYYSADSSSYMGFVNYHLINYDDNKQVSICTTIERFQFDERKIFPSMAYYIKGKIYKEWTIARHDTLYRHYTYNDQGNIIEIKSTHPSGNSNFKFDDKGRIIERSFYKGKEKELIKYSYSDFDRKGNYRRMESTDSTVVTREIEYY